MRKLFINFAEEVNKNIPASRFRTAVLSFYEAVQSRAVDIDPDDSFVLDLKKSPGENFEILRNLSVRPSGDLGALRAKIFEELRMFNLGEKRPPWEFDLESFKKVINRQKALKCGASSLH